MIRTPAVDSVRFVLDGEVITLEGVEPTRSVLDYLRENLGRTGAKEGCAEGDCGACTVVLAELDDQNRLRFRAANACIQFVPTLDGKALFTVESLAGLDGRPHPVQRAMVDCHGSQCGFCTPGFVMSLFALYKTQERPDRRTVNDALAGNLCRCTGYRPIAEAAARMYDSADPTPDDPHWLNHAFSHEPSREPGTGERRTIELLQALRRRDTLTLGDGDRRFFAPTRLAALAELAEAHPEACLLAGGTDVGLWVTKQYRDLGTVIYLGKVAELKTLRVTDGHLEIGAGVSLTDAGAALVAQYPELTDLFRRFASPPIRNVGTLGGNIANGSPIGDALPVLIALDAALVLRRGQTRRELPLEDYYLAYRKTDRRPGEFLERIRVPLPRSEGQVRVYKVSKRFDQDISAVCGAYQVVLEAGRVRQARVCYGGMAPIPKRAGACEQALTGQAWDEATVCAAMDALDRDYEPLTDMRASSDYRRQVARNLLYKFYLETREGEAVATQVYDYGR